MYDMATMATSFRLSDTTLRQLDELAASMTMASAAVSGDLPPTTYSRTDALAHAVALAVDRYAGPDSGGELPS